MTDILAHLSSQAAFLLWRSIIDDMPHMVSVKDIRTRRYIFCNLEACKVLGADAVGKTNFEIFEEDIASQIDAAETQLVSTGIVAITENIVKDRHGLSWTMRTKKFLVSFSEDDQYIITVSEDFSEKYTQQLNLKEAKSIAEEANAAKSAFLAMMSHEIRTPLNGILGMAHAMSLADLSSEQQQRLSIIRDCGQDLLIIVNDVLDFSKIEAGRLDLEVGAFDIDHITATIHATFSAVAEAKGINLVTEVKRDARGLYQGDPVRFRQILSNLISNGLKFTQAGEVKVLADRKGDDLIVTVRDTGIGIPAGRVDAVFNKFTQAAVETSRQFGGTGLGLAICRELSHLMGGQISVASEIGKGSTFKVSLPLPWLGPPEQAGAARPTALSHSGFEAVSGLRILAAEDNVVNQLVLKTFLAQVGFAPVFVSDGCKAVEAWEQKEWDLILMDVRMPVMDGLEATQLIRSREQGSRRRRTPIIALTADALDHQAQAYIDKGMDDFVAKPLEAQALFDVLKRNIRQTKPSE